MIRHRPFLKWAGNKYQILEHIMAILLSGHRLIEPFAGSGAVFLNADYESCLLADSSRDLINLYLTLQREGESFIDYCRKYFTPETNEQKRYYELRQEFNNTQDTRLKAALLSSGSVDEKFPYTYLNCVEAMPERDIIIIVDGGGAKQGAVNWLRNAAAARKYAGCRDKRIQVMNLSEFLVWANRTFR